MSPVSLMSLIYTSLIVSCVPRETQACSEECMQPNATILSMCDQSQMKCLKEANVSCINPISGPTTKEKISMRELIDDARANK